MKKQIVKPMEEPWKLLKYWKQEWKCVLLITCSGILYNVGMLTGPILQGKLLDALLKRETIKNVMLLAALFVASIIMVQAFRYMKRFYIRRFANKTSATMRFMIYNNVIHKSEQQLEKENLGSLMTKAISDVEACVEGMRKFTTEVFDTGVFLVAYLVTLFLYDVKATILACVWIPLAMFVARSLKKRIYLYTSSYRKQLGEVSAITYDYIDHAILYRLYGREEENQEEYKKQLNILEKRAVKANIWENAMPPIYHVIAMIGIIFVFSMLGKRVIDGTFSVGQFLAYTSIFTAMAVKASKAAKLFHSVQKATVSWKRIQPFMEAYKREKREEKTLGVKDNKGLEVRNLSVSYKEKEKQIDTLNLSVNMGEIIGITGPVACGKSTFGKLFLGTFPYKGSILIEGRELSTMTELERSQKISYMGHEPYLLSDTIYENITLGDQGDISFVLQMVCFDKDLESMEEGIQTRVGNGGVRLSGGQQARIALARTLYHKRKLFVLDDPFASVDKGTEEEILQNIKRERKDSMILLISHRLSQFKTMDKVLFMHADKTYEVGTHNKLLQESILYSKLYDLQDGKEGKRE